MDIEEVSSAIREWAASEPLVVRAYIFGSRARGDQREDSDLDVAVEIEKGAGEGAGDENVLATWIFEARRLRKSVLPYKVDLQLLEADSAIVLSGVNQCGILVYDRQR